MKKQLDYSPVLRKLLRAARLKGDLAATTGNLPVPAPSVDMLLVVTKSQSSRWQGNTTYFTVLDTQSIDSLQSAGASLEGYLFLIEQEDNPVKWSITLPAAASYIRLCEHVVELSEANDPLLQFRGQIYFQELLYELYRIDRQAVHDARTAVEHTREYMESNYAEVMSVKSLAEMAGISPSYYLELFKKIVGRSPIEYLTSVRINAAKRLMEQTEAPTHQIAETVGYKDPFYFSRQFKQATGMSPSRYAERDRNRIAAFHYPMTGQMLALQNIPYAAPLDREFCLFYKHKYEQQIPVHLKDPSMENNMLFNLEALQAGRPDLIIAGDWLPEAGRGELERIAPTLYVPWWEKDWRQHLLIVAQFLGETVQAERWLTQYEIKAATIRSKLKERLRDGSILAIHILNGSIHRFGGRNLGAVLYGDLGLRLPDSESTEPAYEILSIQQLIALNPDRLLVAIGSDPQARTLWQDLTQMPEWQYMTAVRNRHVQQIQPDPWFDYSAMGHERILRAVIKLFSLDRPS
ncbi:helix-turn-helix domain-containing protein [Paenibacillus sp. NPDC057934]|uniref:helix-turn-helix domain-containing protein n=1 Tax=Paenibacillus sp. NPDC057934 TaxID=3346282 RepID=UPI0036DEB28C